MIDCPGPPAYRGECTNGQIFGFSHNDAWSIDCKYCDATGTVLECPTCEGTGIHYENHGPYTETLGCPDCRGLGTVSASDIRFWLRSMGFMFEGDPALIKLQTEINELYKRVGKEPPWPN